MFVGQGELVPDHRINVIEVSSPGPARELGGGLHAVGTVRG